LDGSHLQQIRRAALPQINEQVGKPRANDGPRACFPSWRCFIAFPAKDLTHGGFSELLLSEAGGQAGPATVGSNKACCREGSRAGEPYSHPARRHHLAREG
jgi:hypothetical protein